MSLKLRKIVNTCDQPLQNNIYFLFFWMNILFLNFSYFVCLHNMILNNLKIILDLLKMRSIDQWQYDASVRVV